MMRETLATDLRSAMMGKRETQSRVLRLLIAAIKNEEVTSRTDSRKGVLTDSDVLVILRREIRQHEESLEEAIHAGRDDLTAAQEAELEVLRSYLPVQFSRAQVAEVIDIIVQARQQDGVVGPKQKGAIIKEAMAALSGNATGQLVNEIVSEKLGKNK